MRLAAHITEIGMPFGCAAAGRAKQIPGHIQDAGTRRPQEHLQDGATIHLPAVGQRVGTDTLNR